SLVVVLSFALVELLGSRSQAARPTSRTAPVQLRIRPLRRRRAPPAEWLRPEAAEASAHTAVPSPPSDGASRGLRSRLGVGTASVAARRSAAVPARSSSR